MNSAVEQIERLLASLSRAEKAEVLRSVVSDLGDFPGIESTPGVCGGVACVIRTRIPVWAVERFHQLGASDAEILRAYPTLRAEDLVNARAYAHAHREEIEIQIRENEEA